MDTVPRMPAGRPPRHSHRDFVDVGISFADRHGIPALTLRHIGMQLGVSTTAVYRYFPDKGALLGAMRDALLADVANRLTPVDDPAANLIGMATAMRHVARKHPCFGQVLLESPMTGPAIDTIPRLAFGYLEALGLPSRVVGRAYRQLESTALGVTIFDLSGAPAHLEQRLDRMQRLGHRAYPRNSTDITTIEAENEAAFRATIETLVAALSAEGAATGRASHGG